MSNALAQLGGLSVVRPEPLTPTPGKPVGLWLMSDLHIGAANTDHDRIARDIRRAVKRKDRILINGDVFDAIVSQDPRYCPTTMHPRLLDNDHPMDEALAWAVELLKPAASAGLLDYMGHGNHETSLNKRSGSNLLTQLHRELGKWGSCPRPVGYCGFAQYRFRGGDGGRTVDGRFTVFAHHGNRSGTGRGWPEKLSKFIHADVIWVGHFHQKHSTGGYVITPDAAGNRVRVWEQRHVMTGGYTFAYGTTPAGEDAPARDRYGRFVDRYAAVNGYPPGLLGGARVTLTWSAGEGLEVEVSN